MKTHLFIIAAIFILCLDTAQTFQEKAKFIEADLEYEYHILNDYFGEAFGFLLPLNASNVFITVTTDSQPITAMGRWGAWPSLSVEYYSYPEFVPCTDSVFPLEYPSQTGIVANINATVPDYPFMPGHYFYFAPVLFDGPNTTNGNVSVHFEYCPPGQIAAEVSSGCADYTEVELPYSMTNVTMDTDPFYKFYVVQVPANTAKIDVAVSNSEADLYIIGEVGSAGTFYNRYQDPSHGISSIQNVTVSFDAPPVGAFVVTIKCETNCTGITFDVSIDITVCPADWAATNGACNSELNLMLYQSPFSVPVNVPAKTAVYFGVHLGAMAAYSCNVTLTKTGTGMSSVLYRAETWPSQYRYDATLPQTAVIKFFPEDFYVPNDRWYYLAVLNDYLTSDSWFIAVTCEAEVAPSPSPLPSPSPSPASNPSSSPAPSPSPQPVVWNSLSRLHWMEADTNNSCTIMYDEYDGDFLPVIFGEMFGFLIPENASSINVTWSSVEQAGGALAKLGSWPLNSFNKLEPEDENYYVNAFQEFSNIVFGEESVELHAGSHSIHLPLWQQGSGYDFVPGSYIYFSTIAFMPVAAIKVQVEYCPEGQIAAYTPQLEKCAPYQTVPANFSASDVTMDSNSFYKYYLIDVPENTARVNVTVSNTLGMVTISGRVGSAATDFDYYDHFQTEAPGQTLVATFSNPPPGNFVVTVYIGSQTQFDIQFTTTTCPEGTAADDQGACIWPLMKAHYSETLGTNSIVIPAAINEYIPSWVFLGVHFGPLAINYCNASLIESPGGSPIGVPVYLRRMAWPTEDYYDALLLSNVTMQLAPEDIYVPNDIWYYLGFQNLAPQQVEWQLTVTCEAVVYPSPSPTPVRSPSVSPSNSLHPTPSKSPIEGNSNNNKDSEKLSKGSIIGIAVGVPLGFLAIIGALFVFLLIRNQHKTAEHKNQQAEMKQMAPRDEEEPKAPSPQNPREPQSSDSESSEEESESSSDESSEPSSPEAN